jgi:hypothetical protein
MLRLTCEMDETGACTQVITGSMNAIHGLRQGGIRSKRALQTRYEDATLPGCPGRCRQGRPHQWPEARYPHMQSTRILI